MIQPFACFALQHVYFSFRWHLKINPMIENAKVVFRPRSKHAAYSQQFFLMRIDCYFNEFRTLNNSLKNIFVNYSQTGEGLRRQKIRQFVYKPTNLVNQQYIVKGRSAPSDASGVIPDRYHTVNYVEYRPSNRRIGDVGHCI